MWVSCGYVASYITTCECNIILRYTSCCGYRHTSHMIYRIESSMSYGKWAQPAPRDLELLEDIFWQSCRTLWLLYCGMPSVFKHFNLEKWPQTLGASILWSRFEVKISSGSGIRAILRFQHTRTYCTPPKQIVIRHNRLNKRDEFYKNTDKRQSFQLIELTALCHSIL